MTSQPSETRLARGVVIFIALVVAFNLLVLLVRIFTNSETVEGPAGSSYVTGPFGTAAIYELFDELGQEPLRLTSGMTSRTLDPSDALFILEPRFAGATEPELVALERFVDQGGRLIISGAFADSFIEPLFDDVPAWDFGELSSKASTVFPTVPSPDVRTLSGNTFGGWSEPGAFLPLVVDEFGLPVVIQRNSGAGTVIWLGDGSFLANRWVGELDNAAFAVALSDGRQPVFNEVVHGAADGGSLLPERWRTAFWLALAAVVVALVAYGYRNGPPEEVVRRLDPERIGYVESMAGNIARSADSRLAVQPIRSTARRLLIGRDASAGARIDNQRLIELATHHGLSRQEAEALINEDDSSDPIDVAAAFATLQRRLKERL